MFAFVIGRRLNLPLSRVVTMNEHQQTAFGPYLKKLRQRRRLKQKNVASELRIKPESLSMIERGKRKAPDELLIQLAEKYQVPLEEVLLNKYWPQLPLLTGIMKPAELIRDIQKELHPEDMQEVTRYIAFLLLRRTTANKS